jgi:ABC-2 type transport system ATP-binding protein
MEEADALCDRVALMHLGTIRATGPVDELRHEVGSNATLEDVFRHHTGDTLEGGELGKGGLREIRRTRRTAGRVG